jgi:hypothetical protein
MQPPTLTSSDTVRVEAAEVVAVLLDVVHAVVHTPTERVRPVAVLEVSDLIQERDVVRVRRPRHRVCSFEVEYIEWNAWGSSVHVAAFGWNSGCWKPFATLAVIDPVWFVVLSLTDVTTPSVESWSETTSWSPGSMNEFAHSSPARLRQSALFVWVRLSESPKMATAAHPRSE